MPDHAVPADPTPTDEATPFERLIGDTARRAPEFTTAFRGYDKDEVDAALADLSQRLRSAVQQVEVLEHNQRRARAAVVQSREKAARLEAEAAAAGAHGRDSIERLEAELAAAQARAANAEAQIAALTEELTTTGGETPSRQQFEEVLRVAEEQASVLIRNASTQGERLLEAARAENDSRRAEAQAEADALRSQAEHDAQQARLRIETELTAHQARIEREAAHAAEKVAQAEREAAAIRSEAEKGAAALRSMVARETAHARAEAEEAVRELRVRALEFEESLTRRQDDAQQEFLVLHNQAVAHAERITQDANDQVAASLEHAQRVAAKAEDFERLMRAQAQQIEADAHLRAREELDKARVKAQRIIDLVTSHSQGVLRDAEDRTRQLRWQQHQLTSFMSEVKELIRPEGPLAPAAAAGAAQVLADEAPVEEARGDEHQTVVVDAELDAASDDAPRDDVDAELAELVEQAEQPEQESMGS